MNRDFLEMIFDDILEKFITIIMMGTVSLSLATVVVGLHELLSLPTDAAYLSSEEVPCT